MNELLKFFSSQQIDTPVLIFLLIFSEGIALFYTLIFNGLYNINIRPKYLFFITHPLLVVIAYLVRPGWALLIVSLLFVSIFLIGVIGMVISIFRSSKENKETDKRFNDKYQTPKKGKFQRSIQSIGVFGFLIIGFWLYSEGKLSLLLLIIPLIFILDSIFFPTSRTRFYKLQAILPTSKMNAVAMGLVEVAGDLIELEPLISPHFQTPCIGYSIRIEQRRRDKDGNTTWSNIFSERKTSTFRIKDETGSVLVNGDGLDYYIQRVDKEVESGDKRYYETYLKNDDYLLLIGKATSNNGETLIQKDDHHGVFGVAFPHEVAIKNKFTPLYKSFFTTLFFITLIIIYIIIS